MREWLSSLRNEQNLTIQDMAKKLNISAAYYSMIENGKRQQKMDITLISALSTALGISIEKIIEYETAITTKQEVKP